MKPLKALRAILRNWIEDDSIDDVFQNYINYGIEECENTVNFQELFRSETLTPDANGIITEPALSREITSIVPYTASGYPQFEFKFTDTQPNYNDGGMRNYTASPSTPVESADGTHSASVTQGSTTLTYVATSWLTSADIGKRLMIAGEEELYQIISVVDNTSAVVYPEVSSATSSSATVIVNPTGTRKIQLRDPSNVPYTGNVTVNYQRKHPIVYKDESMLLIPCPQSVALIALQQALMTNKYDVDASRLETAVMLAKNRELDNVTFKKRIIKRRDNMFSVRDRISRPTYRY